MATSSDAWHEGPEGLTTETKDLHRAIMSLAEELEAVDWYHQRIAVAGDSELKAILTHNRDEEKEHASMVLEWIRRRDPIFSAHLKEYLFTKGKIGEKESAGEAGKPAASSTAGDGSLGIGSLKGEASRHG
jgi:ferritin-like protein